MYFFTMALGLLLIVYGLYLESQPSEAFELEEFSDIERLYRLEEKVNLMEDSLKLGESDYLLDQIRTSQELGEESRDRDIKERENKNIRRQIENNYRGFIEKDKSDIEEKYSLYSDYKADGYSQEEICRMLDMTKGEVILLEKLRRD